METACHERDHHISSEPDQTTGKLSVVGRESIGPICSHEDRSMDLEAPLAQESRPSCNPPDDQEQETSQASCPYCALPRPSWPQPGSSSHGVTDSMGSSSSPRSPDLGYNSPDGSETRRQHSYSMPRTHRGQ